SCTSYSLLTRGGRRKNFAGAIVAHFGYDTRGLHLFNQARCAIITNAQFALHRRDTGLTGFGNERHSFVEQWVGFVPAVATTTAPVVRKPRNHYGVCRFTENFFKVVGFATLFPII